MKELQEAADRGCQSTVGACPGYLSLRKQHWGRAFRGND